MVTSRALGTSARTCDGSYERVSSSKNRLQGAGLSSERHEDHFEGCAILHVHLTTARKHPWSRQFPHELLKLKEGSLPDGELPEFPSTRLPNRASISFLSAAFDPNGLGSREKISCISEHCLLPIPCSIQKPSPTRLHSTVAQSAATCFFLHSLASSDLAHSPATCAVATLRRFQTFVVAIQRTSDASALSS